MILPLFVDLKSTVRIKWGTVVEAKVNKMSERRFTEIKRNGLSLSVS